MSLILPLPLLFFLVKLTLKAVSMWIILIQQQKCVFLTERFIVRLFE